MKFSHGFHLELLVLLLDNVLELIRNSPYRVYFVIYMKMHAKWEAAKSHDRKHPERQSLMFDEQDGVGVGGMESTVPP
jgi:hypothetical protein